MALHKEQIACLLRSLQRFRDTKTYPDLRLSIQEINSLIATVSNIKDTLNSLTPYEKHAKSQYGEAITIAALFPASSGVYVDIGANTPRECSNTWEFYQKGWSGLLIEPQPSCWGSLLYQRPRDSLCPLAVSDKEELVPFYVAGFLTTLRKGWLPENVNYSRELVQTNTLENILNNYPSIRDTCDFCSIDVEGYEKNVLLGNNFDTFSPSLFVVEYRETCDSVGKDISTDWIHILFENGYNLIDMSELNMLFLHDRSMHLWDEYAKAFRMCSEEELNKYKERIGENSRSS